MFVERSEHRFQTGAELNAALAALRVELAHAAEQLATLLKASLWKPMSRMRRLS